MAEALIVASLATTAIGTVAGAFGARSQGVAAQQAAQFQAEQDRQNATQAVAAGQRQALDTQERTRLAISSTVARAGASGVSADTGSPLADVGAIAKRGSYLAAMDLYRGQNTATGLENAATGTIYSGNVAKTAGDINAFGTIAGGAGSMISQYGRYAYPQVYGGMR